MGGANGSFFFSSFDVVDVAAPSYKWSDATGARTALLDQFSSLAHRHRGANNRAHRGARGNALANDEHAGTDAGGRSDSKCCAACCVSAGGCNTSHITGACQCSTADRAIAVQHDVVAARAGVLEVGGGKCAHGVTRK